MSASTEVPAGYKLTEIGVIPADWESVRLGDIGESLSGLTYHPTNVKTSGTLVLRASNIHNNALKFEDNVYVDCEIPERIMVSPGDVLICVRNGSRALIGKTAYLDKAAIGMTFGAFMAIHRSRVGKLIAQFFQSEILKRQVHEHLGATINQITNKSLNSFLVPLPKNEREQQAISNALSDVDALLDALDRQIAKQRDLKQAAMQQLLTGRKRLPGFTAPWARKALGALGIFLRGKGVRRDDAQSGSIPCIRYGEIYTHHNDVIRTFYSWISPPVAATAMRLQYGDLIFTSSGEKKEEIGKCVAFTSDQEAYVGGDTIILRAHGMNPVFMGYYCNAPHINEQKTQRAQGDAVVHIGVRALADISVEIPELNEQSAIASVLSDMDAQIAALEARRAKTAAIKQGMMQELLTGRTRLV